MFDKPVYLFLTYSTFADGFGLLLADLVVQVGINFLIYLLIKKLKHENVDK